MYIVVNSTRCSVSHHRVLKYLTQSSTQVVLSLGRAQAKCRAWYSTTRTMHACLNRILQAISCCQTGFRDPGIARATARTHIWYVFSYIDYIKHIMSFQYNIFICLFYIFYNRSSSDRRTDLNLNVNDHDLL